MNARAKLILFWGLRLERPVAFHAYSGNEKQKVEMGPRTSWARVAETLDALDPERIDALNPNGNIIRSCKPDELEGEAEDAAEDSEGEGAAEASPVVAFDAETARLKLVIDAVNHAHDSAQEKVGLRNGEVFDRMIDLFETVKALVVDQSKVLNHQNSTIQKMQEEQLRDALERAQKGESGDSWLDDIVRPFADAMRQPAGGDDEPEPDDEPAAETPPAPNGKGH
jgi:hypothetical protein